jgi:hypothetical protein
MSTVVKQYEVWCTVEGAMVRTWSDAVPTVCPHDQTHAIDAARTSVITPLSTATDPSFSAGKSYNGTQGYYQCRGLRVDVDASPMTYATTVFSHPVVVYGGRFMATIEHVGDTLDVLINPNTPIGALTAAAAPGDVTISVTDSVAQYAKVGFGIALHDPAAAPGATQFAQVARVVQVSAPSSGGATLVLDQALGADAGSFPAGTLVLLRIHIVDSLPIEAPGQHSFGYGTGAGKLLPADTVVGVEYQNASGTPKTFSLIYEITY